MQPHEAKQHSGVRSESPLGEVPTSTWPARTKAWNDEKGERRLPPPAFPAASLTHLSSKLGGSVTRTPAHLFL